MFALGSQFRILGINHQRITHYPARQKVKSQNAARVFLFKSLPKNQTLAAPVIGSGSYSLALNVIEGFSKTCYPITAIPGVESSTEAITGASCFMEGFTTCFRLPPKRSDFLTKAI